MRNFPIYVYIQFYAVWCKHFNCLVRQLKTTLGVLDKSVPAQLWFYDLRDAVNGSGLDWTGTELLNCFESTLTFPKIQRMRVGMVEVKDTFQKGLVSVGGG